MEQQHTPTPTEATDLTSAIDQCKRTVTDHIDRLITILTESDSTKKTLLYGILREKGKTLIADYYDTISMLHRLTDDELIKMFKD